jgi:hypothetical protein
MPRCAYDVVGAPSRVTASAARGVVRACSRSNVPGVRRWQHSRAEPNGGATGLRARQGRCRVPFGDRLAGALDPTYDPRRGAVMKRRGGVVFHAVAVQPADLGAAATRCD